MVKLNFGFWHLNRLITLVFPIALLQFAVCPVRALPIKIAEASEAGSLEDTSEDNTFSCPNDLKQLTPLLLKDLPSYGNRIIQRTQDINQAAGIENYLLTASEAEFEPLSLPRLQYDRLEQEDPGQIFFTVLERQYINGKIVDIETYHWLFLTQTDSGWRTVILFSRFGNSNQKNPPTPPRETTNSIIGQGVQLWLRDCRAGMVRGKR